MRIIKHLEFLTLPALILAVLITGLTLKKSHIVNEPKADLEQLEGVSEFYFKPEGDSRTWHVSNTYTSELSENAPEYNNSVYLFTSDLVTVTNNYVGINRSDFIANK
jgi:hypothetical protein